eukprot:6163814-Pyramimonas_sp.AAC.2
MQVDHMLLLSEQVSVRKVRCAPDSLLLLVHNTVDALSWPVGSLLVGGIEWGCTDEEDEYEVPFYRELVSAEQVNAHLVRIRTYGRGMLSAFKHGHIKYRCEQQERCMPDACPISRTKPLSVSRTAVA